MAASVCRFDTLSAPTRLQSSPDEADSASLQKPIASAEADDRLRSKGPRAATVCVPVRLLVEQKALEAIRIDFVTKCELSAQKSTTKQPSCGSSQ